MQSDSNWSSNSVSGLGLNYCHWPMGNSFAPPRNAHLNNIPWGYGDWEWACGWKYSQIKWRLDITAFRSLHFCKVHKTTEQGRGACSSSSSSFCSREQNNFQCSLNCGGNERSPESYGLRMRTGLHGQQETGSWLRFALCQQKTGEKGEQKGLKGKSKAAHSATCVVFKTQPALVSGHKWIYLFYGFTSLSLCFSRVGTIPFQGV